MEEMQNLKLSERDKEFVTQRKLNTEEINKALRVSSWPPLPPENTDASVEIKEGGRNKMGMLGQPSGSYDSNWKDKIALIIFMILVLFPVVVAIHFAIKYW